MTSEATRTNASSERRGVAGAAERITAAATAWPGVEAGFGGRGEYGFRLGRRELGHLHGDRALHIGFPKRVGRELREQGRVADHPVFPGNDGWAARRIATEEDVVDAVALLRMNYDRAVERHGLPAEDSSAGAGLPAGTPRREES